MSLLAMGQMPTSHLLMRDCCNTAIRHHGDSPACHSSGLSLFFCVLTPGHGSSLRLRPTSPPMPARAVCASLVSLVSLHYANLARSCALVSSLSWCLSCQP